MCLGKRFIALRTTCDIWQFYNKKVFHKTRTLMKKDVYAGHVGKIIHRTNIAM